MKTPLNTIDIPLVGKIVYETLVKQSPSSAWTIYTPSSGKIEILYLNKQMSVEIQAAKLGRSFYRSFSFIDDEATRKEHEKFKAFYELLLSLPQVSKEDYYPNNKKNRNKWCM